MAQTALLDGHGYGLSSTLATHYTPPTSTFTPEIAASDARGVEWNVGGQQEYHNDVRSIDLGSTGKGILIGMLSAFGSAALIGLIIAIVYFFRYTNRGRILLDRMSRPGEFDDEQSFLREEEDALSEMDERQRGEYFRAKGGSCCGNTYCFCSTDDIQLLYKLTHLNRCRPIYHYHNS